VRAGAGRIYGSRSIGGACDFGRIPSRLTLIARAGSITRWLEDRQYDRPKGLFRAAAIRGVPCRRRWHD